MKKLLKLATIFLMAATLTSCISRTYYVYGPQPGQNGEAPIKKILPEDKAAFTPATQDPSRAATLPASNVIPVGGSSTTTTTEVKKEIVKDKKPAPQPVPENSEGVLSKPNTQ
jgi:hypothetical protein